MAFSTLSLELPLRLPLSKPAQTSFPPSSAVPFLSVLLPPFRCTSIASLSVLMTQHEISLSAGRLEEQNDVLWVSGGMDPSLNSLGSW